ncbi:MAG: hypothetical protein ACI92E_000102 [Oceanicoccus sp.]|jgi:hypothetical protein
MRVVVVVVVVVLAGFGSTIANYKNSGTKLEPYLTTNEEQR